MTCLVLPTFEGQLQGYLVLEEVGGTVEVETQGIYICAFEYQVAAEIEVTKAVRDICQGQLVNLYVELQIKLSQQFIRYVFLCGTIIEQTNVGFFELTIRADEIGYP